MRGGSSSVDTRTHDGSWSSSLTLVIAEVLASSAAISRYHDDVITSTWIIKFTIINRVEMTRVRSKKDAFGTKTSKLMFDDDLTYLLQS